MLANRLKNKILLSARDRAGPGQKPFLSHVEEALIEAFAAELEMLKRSVPRPQDE